MPITTDQTDMLQVPHAGSCGGWFEAAGVTLNSRQHPEAWATAARFERSDPTNAYHGFIESTYAPSVVTASVHINLGINRRLESLFARLPADALRGTSLLTGLERPVSPSCEWQSKRAHSSAGCSSRSPRPRCRFCFLDHHHYASAWMEEQMAAGQHARRPPISGTSVRPQRESRPHDPHRLEIRICDLMQRPLVLWRSRASIELRRVGSSTRIQRPHDPLRASQQPQPAELAETI